jgi:hypothetical protein
MISEPNFQVNDWSTYTQSDEDIAELGRISNQVAEDMTRHLDDALAQYPIPNKTYTWSCNNVEQAEHERQDAERTIPFCIPDLDGQSLTPAQRHIQRNILTKLHAARHIPTDSSPIQVYRFFHHDEWDEQTQQFIPSKRKTMKK